ncbi:MAG TPA: hypothetical protein VN442_01050 [Bryobacteraceae bacterium]|nr:hypothetical protein [Bryobacteraceae bacterium]
MQPYRLQALLLLAGSFVSGQTGTIQTVVGGNRPLDSGGYRGGLGYPGGAAVDTAGNLYVSLSDRRGVLRIDAATGAVTRVAGVGKGGYSGDHGPAPEALMSRPCGIAFDARGNLYIADPANARVRMVSNGIITTVAGNGTQSFGGDGGPADQAQLSSPSDVAVDAAGNLYIADWGNRRIRKVSGGIITTIAGDGVAGDSGDRGPAVRARLSSPSGLAIDSAGNLYIADANVPRIRMISGGTITTVAGSGSYGYSGDGGPAKRAQLSNPVGIAVDFAGNLFIADANNHRIRKVSNGTIMTVAGNGSPGYDGDGGAATGARLNWPRSVAVDAAGRLYVVDARNECVRVVQEGAR